MTIRSIDIHDYSDWERADFEGDKIRREALLGIANISFATFRAYEVIFRHVCANSFYADAEVNIELKWKFVGDFDWEHAQKISKIVLEIVNYRDAPSNDFYEFYCLREISTFECPFYVIDQQVVENLQALAKSLGAKGHNDSFY